MLIYEDARVVQQTSKMAGQAILVCICIDGWTSAGNQSVYAVNIVLETTNGRVTLLYDATDFSADRHTGEFIAGLPSVAMQLLHSVWCYILTSCFKSYGCHADAIHDWAKQIGIKKVAAIITDNAANMVKARELAVQKEGMGHIIPLR